MRVNIGFPVVRTDGRAYGHVITKFSRMGRLPHFLSYGAPSTRALRARVELRYNAEPCGGAGSVEVYDEKNNTWSVVDQPHIPPNNLGAIEVEGSVYFIINSFPVDSGIRIPPGEVYSVSLDEWEDLECIKMQFFVSCQLRRKA